MTQDNSSPSTISSTRNSRYLSLYMKMKEMQYWEEHYTIKSPITDNCDCGFIPQFFYIRLYLSKLLYVFKVIKLQAPKSLKQTQ